MRLTLLTRSYCHLCDDMRAALVAAFPALAAELIELDVDADVELESRYGELIPVLLAGDKQVCHYHFDAQALGTLLRDEQAQDAENPSASAKIAD